MRGRVILGVQSYGEFLQFSQSVVAPKYTYQLCDTIIPCFYETIRNGLSQLYEPFSALARNAIVEFEKALCKPEKMPAEGWLRLKDFFKGKHYVYSLLLILSFCNDLMHEALKRV